MSSWFGRCVYRMRFNMRCGIYSFRRGTITTPLSTPVYASFLKIVVLRRNLMPNSKVAKDLIFCVQLVVYLRAALHVTNILKIFNKHVYHLLFLVLFM